MKEIKTIEEIRNIRKNISDKQDNDPRKYVEYLISKQKNRSKKNNQYATKET